MSTLCNVENSTTDFVSFSTSDQCCFNVDALWINVDPRLKFRPGSQFLIPGYHIVRKDRNQNGGWILFYINEDITFKVIESKQLPINLDILTLEIFSTRNADERFQYDSRKQKM